MLLPALTFQGLNQNVMRIVCERNKVMLYNKISIKNAFFFSVVNLCKGNEEEN